MDSINDSSFIHINIRALRKLNISEPLVSHVAGDYHIETSLSKKFIECTLEDKQKKNWIVDLNSFESNFSY